MPDKIRFTDKWVAKFEISIWGSSKRIDELEINHGQRRKQPTWNRETLSHNRIDEVGKLTRGQIQRRKYLFENQFEKSSITIE